MAGPPLILPPAAPKQQVQILQAAVRKTDPEYSTERQKKLTGEDSTPLMPEAFEKVVRELPREPEIIDLFKNLSGADPFPPR